MSEVLFRCSSLGKIMTEPKTQKEGPLSVGAKTYIRTLAAQDLFGIDFELSSKEIEKGLEVEDESIEMQNRVRGLNLKKNTERRSNGLITGECDLFDAQARHGYDIKSSWSAQTFPIATIDCEDKLYEWQACGYMILWDADAWTVSYCLVDTPERLIRYEPIQLHLVGHIPERMRITSWTIRRDAAKEEAIKEKVRHARDYYMEVINEFDRTHKAGNPLPIVRPAQNHQDASAPWDSPAVPAALTSPLAGLLSA